MYQRRVVLYARSRSLRCWRAKRILARGGYHFEVVEAAEDSPSGLRKRLTHGRTYRQAVPYLFVDDRPVGGLAEIRALGGSGTLEHLVRDELEERRRATLLLRDAESIRGWGNAPYSGVRRIHLPRIRVHNDHPGLRYGLKPYLRTVALAHAEVGCLGVRYRGNLPRRSSVQQGGVSEVRVVEAWHAALNEGDVDRLVGLSHPDVEVGGPRGAGRGVQLLREWVNRANIRLEPRRLFSRGGTVVVEQAGQWRSAESGEVIGSQSVAAVFAVCAGLVISLVRYDDLLEALKTAGLDQSDEIRLEHR